MGIAYGVVHLCKLSSKLVLGDDSRDTEELLCLGGAWNFQLQVKFKIHTGSTKFV